METFTKLGLLSAECSARIFEAHDFFYAPCLKQILSKLLGWGVIAGAAGVKVPQILKITRSGSTENVSTTMFLLELLGYLITMAYNIMSGYPFSTYGENLFLFTQSVILVMLMLSYNNERHMVPFVVFFYGAVGGILFSGRIPSEGMQLLQSATIPIFAASKIPQIITIFRAGSSGQLSFVTVFLSFAGSAARIFTTLQEVDDVFVLAGTVSSTLLNGILVAQVLFYWKVPAATAGKERLKAQ